MRLKTLRPQDLAFFDSRKIIGTSSLLEAILHNNRSGCSMMYLGASLALATEAASGVI